MSIQLNGILRENGLDPKDVRLVRHKDQRSSPGRSPYELWRDDPEGFHDYQSSQRISNRKKFSAPFWAVFVADAFDDTVFVGLFAASYRGLLEQDRPKPHVIGEIDAAGSCDIYDLELDSRLKQLIGRLVIDWGAGERAWVQYADRQDKEILELRARESERPFPGFINFIEPLSRIGKLPAGWIEVLRSARGVYILSCPRTKEQYIGSAGGVDGFWGRWMQYFKTGHGGNEGLKSRDPSDYQVAILEIAGTPTDHDAILSMEGRWQRKLRSKEMGLNRNLAKSK
jgi:hypothetical protein